MTPRARTERLVVEELPDELLVYDLNVHRAHCLNRTAAMVWHLCDGETSAAEMAARMQEVLATPIDEPVVRLALDQLEKAHLLEALPEMAGTRVSRRVLIGQAMVAAGIALPVVLSVRSPVAAASGPPPPPPG